MRGFDARGVCVPSPDARIDSDRRSRSRRAQARRRAAEDALLDAMLLPTGSPSVEIGSEGQTLLARALARLARQEDVTAAIAWSIDATGAPRVLAAHPAEAAHRIVPVREVYDAVAALAEPTTPSEVDSSAPLAALAMRGVGAVAPVAGLGCRAAAVVLLLSDMPRSRHERWHTDDATHLAHTRTRSLRPRTLAVLSEVTSQLGESLSIRLALDRLGRLDTAVRRMDRLAALGELTAEIVHEIRNPLVSVKTFLQLLPDRLSDPEFHDEFRSLVTQEVLRLERMLDDLLRQARPGDRSTVGAEPVQTGGRIDEAIATTLQLLTYRCRERGLTLETSIAPGLPPLSISSDALRQLLLNLLLNATDMTPEGGRIELSADWSDESVDRVAIRVDDSGPGIDPAARARVFEPFWTSRGDGIGGLGLSICERIVEEAEGTIRVEDGAGGGACFRIELPIAG